MIEFENNKFNTFDNYFDFKYELEDKFHKKLDLATKRMIRERIKRYVEKDLINV